MQLFELFYIIKYIYLFYFMLLFVYFTESTFISTPFCLPSAQIHLLNPKP